MFNQEENKQISTVRSQHQFVMSPVLEYLLDYNHFNGTAKQRTVFAYSCFVFALTRRFKHFKWSLVAQLSVSAVDECISR